MEEVPFSKTQLLCVAGFGRVVIQRFDYLVEEPSVVSWPRIGQDLACCMRLTFLGGRIAIADLGVIETWCGLDSLSPLRDRLIAWWVISAHGGMVSLVISGQVDKRLRKRD
jgi:hypothetical protein